MEKLVKIAALRAIMAAILITGFSGILDAAEIGKSALNDEERKAVPETFGPSDEGIKAISRFILKPGFTVTQVASEPMLGNAVAFDIDHDGTFYTSETYRYRSSVLDIRHYMEWLEDDLAIRNVDDRVAMLKKHLGDQVDQLALETEVVRKIMDRDGDGIADTSEIFADGFNTILDGIASGVLAHRGKIYFTNIPSVWVLEDRDDDGFAEIRDELSTGYGVRFSLTGHDLHGLIVGPDGRLYFSCGDRGSHVVTREGKILDIPDEGGVFRCELDGSNLELFAVGLRNPQELAFDVHGNLFTGDNDSDQGDRERLVYIMEGSDSGWRVGYQHHPIGNGGPWNRELLWRPHFAGQAAYLLPPITNIDNGPSGLVYNYGTGLPKEYDGAFLLCHFNGNSSRSGITAYRVKANGAGFDIIEETDGNGNTVYDQIAWNCLPTDVDFGPDGALYWTDWNQGWPKSNKGRIYRLAHEDELQNPIVVETASILRTGFAKRETDDLIKLLGHRNMQVRLGAQWEIADRGHKNLIALRNVAYGSNNLYARLHAIWAVGQMARQTPYILSDFLGLKNDPEPEVKVQLARIIGDAGYKVGFQTLLNLLDDESSRVKSLAAIALGKIGNSGAIPKLAKLATEVADSDPWLRHGIVMGLAGSGNPKQISALAGKKASPSLQMASVLALRRHASENISAILKNQNTSPLVLAEAARAVNDKPVNGSMQDLADTLIRAESLSGLAPLAEPDDWRNPDRDFRNKVEPILSRGINAAYRIGGADNATALATVAANANVRSSMRVLALGALRDWKIDGVKTARRDRVVGTFRPVTDKEGKEITSRSADDAVAALEASGADIIESRNDKVIVALVQAAKSLEIGALRPELADAVLDSGLQGKTRAAALDALGTLGGGDLFRALNYSLKASDEDLKQAALKILPQINIVQAVKLLRESLNKGTPGEKQAAYSALGFINSDDAGSILLEAMENLKAGKLEQEVQLDVLEAMANSEIESVKNALQEYENSLSKTDWKESHSVTLHGGNAERGEVIFRENQTVQCRRCHMVNDDGGEVGPVLDGIGSRYSRMQLLESLAEPSATIAQGFETVIITTVDGLPYSGTVASEDDSTITVNTPDEGPVDIPKNEIESRESGPSGMPPMLHLALSKKEVRDLIEFLSSLK